jgi:3-oxoacyl-(acyl-carrier-protein) synthase
MGGMSRRVVVTGIGLVSPAGIGIDRAWAGLRTDPPEARLVDVPAATAEDRRFRLFAAPEYRIADVTDTVVGGAQLEREGLDEQRDVKHLVAATGLAIADAGLRTAPTVDLREVGLVVADEHPGVERLARILYAAVGGVGAGAEQPHQDYGALADRIFALNTFLAPYTVARAHGIGGECAFVNSACASGLSAVDNAAAQVRAGRTPVAIAAASDDPFSAGKFRWFADQRLYATDGVVRPFAAAPTGTVFGDGGAALVVEDEEHAVRRGARIYGRYLGAGFTQDGWRVSAPNPKLANQARSIRRALAEAGRDPADVDVLVPHGTGISVIDRYEVRTIRDLWPDPAAQPACVPLKPYVGHNLGGSSLVEAALLLKAMCEGCVPAARDGDAAAPFFALDLPAAWTPRPIGLAVKTTAAFGGFYGSVVLESV